MAYENKFSDNFSTEYDVLSNLAQMDRTDFVSKLVELGVQSLIEAEVTNKIGATKGKHCDHRITHRNGNRQRSITTIAGDINLNIPKLRKGTFLPSIINPRKRVDESLYAVIMESYTNGCSTRKVDEIVKALGSDAGISKSQVSDICKNLDNTINAFKNRKLIKEYEYLYLDATYLKAQTDIGTVNSRAFIIAVGIDKQGYREIVGFTVGDTESEEFWTEFLRSLKQRGLKGVKLAITDANLGLKNACQKVLLCAWQRCKVHFMRNVIAHCNKQNSPIIISLVKQIFKEPTKKFAYERLNQVSEQLMKINPKVSKLLNDSKDDILAYTNFNPKHWSKISSTNHLERLNKEIKRRCDVVQVFPNDTAINRLAGSILMDYNLEWEAENRRFLTLESMTSIELKTPSPPPKLIEK